MSTYETIQVRVIPNSSQNKIDGSISGRTKIRIKASATDNKANEELIKFLSKILNKPQSYIQITYGANSKDKTLKILCFENNELDILK